MRGLYALLAALCLLSGAAQIVLMLRDLRDERERVRTRESLRRLAALTIRNFPDRSLDSAGLFWKAIGRDAQPMRDFWGEEFRIRWTGAGVERVYVWVSSGPDRAEGSADDVRETVPYPPGPTSFPDTLEQGRPAPSSLNAR